MLEAEIEEGCHTLVECERSVHVLHHDERSGGGARGEGGLDRLTHEGQSARCQESVLQVVGSGDLVNRHERKGSLGGDRRGDGKGRVLVTGENRLNSWH